jgi:multidrug efflux pump subunit AcrA (membrane-fusion protein)
VLREGQPAEFLLDALPGIVVRGHIDRIHPVVDPTTGTVEVRLTVESPTDPSLVRLRPGMFATVRIVTDVHEGVVSVPKRALLYEADTPYVFIVGEPWVAPEGSGDGSGDEAESEEGSESGPPQERFVVERVPLQLGYEDPNQVEVLQGLQEGVRVVVTGQSGLDPSSVITIATGVSRLGTPTALPAEPVEGSSASSGSGDK